MCIFRTPCARVPWVPSSEPEQFSPNFQVIDWVKQVFLLAKAELDTGNSVFIATHVPVDSVDLEQARVGLIGRLGVPSDVAVFVNNGTTNAIWAPTRLAEDDLTQLFPSLLRPASLCG